MLYFLFFFFICIIFDHMSFKRYSINNLLKYLIHSFQGFCFCFCCCLFMLFMEKVCSCFFLHLIKLDVLLIGCFMLKKTNKVCVCVCGGGGGKLVLRLIRLQLCNIFMLSKFVAVTLPEDVKWSRDIFFSLLFNLLFFF